MVPSCIGSNKITASPKKEKVDHPLKKDHEPRSFVTKLGDFRNKEEGERALWQVMGV